MRQHQFTVTFVSGAPVQVWALSEVEAIILAQAERIKAGLSYSVLRVEKH